MKPFQTTKLHSILNISEMNRHKSCKISSQFYLCGQKSQNCLEMTLNFTAWDALYPSICDLDNEKTLNREKKGRNLRMRNKVGILRTDRHSIDVVYIKKTEITIVN